MTHNDRIVMHSKNRETWLIDAGLKLNQLFEAAGYKLPHFRISVGDLNSGRQKKTMTLGRAYHPKMANDELSQVFIDAQCDNAVDILSTVAHELIHVIFPNAGHKGDFRRCALDLGFKAPMTQTPMGDELKEKLTQMASDLGEYPHAALKSKSTKKKQTTRMKKLLCNDCGYVVRTTQSNIDKGLPTCCCGGLFELDE